MEDVEMEVEWGRGKWMGEAKLGERIVDCWGGGGLRIGYTI